MSAPDTNMKTQKKRHAPALIGIAIVAVLGVAVILVWIAMATDTSEPAASDASQAEVTTQPGPETEGVVRSEPPAKPLDGVGLSTTQAPETTGVGNVESDSDATEADPIQQ